MIEAQVPYVVALTASAVSPRARDRFRPLLCIRESSIAEQSVRAAPEAAHPPIMSTTLYVREGNDERLGELMPSTYTSFVYSQDP